MGSWSRRSIRISGGSVRPCTTSVLRMTANDITMICSRYGTVSGQRQRGGQRDDPARPGPADDHRRAPVGGRIALAHRAAEQPAQRRRQRDPHQPGADRGGADDRAVPDEDRPRDREPDLADRGELQPDQDEDDAVEHEDQQVPDRARLQAGGGAHDLAEALAHVEAADDAGEDGGGVQPLADDPGGVGREQGDADRGQAVGGQPQRPPRDHADHEPDHDAAHPGRRRTGARSRRGPRRR